ncbi:hypothetical protein D3C76_67970 [compost metagenome]
MRIAALCDFYDDAYRPLKLIVQAKPYELDWSQILYVAVSAPLEPFEAEDYGDETTVSVLMEDLVRRPDHGVKNNDRILGINLPSIFQRHGTEAGLLAIQMDDVEEALGLERGTLRKS